MYVFTPQPAYYRPIYQRPRPYYGYPLPFAFEEPPHWLYHPALDEHLVNESQHPENGSSPFAFEDSVRRLISPALEQQQQVNDNQNRATSSQRGEPTIFLITPAVQQDQQPQQQQQQQPEVYKSPNQATQPSGVALDPTILLLNPLLQNLVLGSRQNAAPVPASLPTPPPISTLVERPVVPGGTEKQSDDKFVAKLQLPEGTTADNLKVRIRDNVLTVTGRSSGTTADSMAVTTSFSRQWTLGEDIDTDHVTAVIEQDGTLVVTVPKKPKVKDVPVADAPKGPKEKPEPSNEATSNKPKSALPKTKELPKPKEPVAAKKKESTPPSSSNKSKKTASPSKAIPHHDVPLELRITQNDNAQLVVTVQVPEGVSPNDLTMEVKDRVLTISGVQHQQMKDSEFTVKFERHLVLDERVETDKMEATLDAEKRILTVSARKKPPLVKPAQKIAIQLTAPAKEQVVEPDEGDSTASTAPSDDTATDSNSISSETKESHEEEHHLEQNPDNTDPNNHVNIAVQEQDSSGGTKIVVETVVDE